MGIPDSNPYKANYGGGWIGNKNVSQSDIDASKVSARAATNKAYQDKQSMNLKKDKGLTPDDISMKDIKNRILKKKASQFGG